MAPLVLAAIKIAAGFVPELIGKMAGPDAENVAARVVDIAQAVTGRPDPESALAELNANPDKVLEFRQQAMMIEADREKAYIGDTQNARARDIELVKTTGRNLRGNVLVAGAGLIVVICLAVVVWRTDMDDYVKATISLILGRALGWVEQVMSFEFGLTRESAKKDDTIKNLSK